MTLQDRLSTYIAFKGLTFKDFERICNLSNGTAARLRDTTRRSTFVRIANACDLNIDWLLTGEGEMLNLNTERNEAPATEVHEPTRAASERVVPLIPTPALANSLAEYMGQGIRRTDCPMIQSPVPGAEFAITISGDSMEPKFHNGMVVFLKRIDEAAFIPWGNTLVIDTVNGAFIKDVFPKPDDDNAIEARSVNPLYPPITIPKSAINGMYRVLNAIKFFTTM